MVLPTLLALPFSRFFLHWFSDLLFNAEQCLKSSEPGPKTAKNPENQYKIIIETHRQPRAAKPFPLRGVKPVKLTTLTTLSAVFPKAQRSQNEATKEGEIEASRTQILQKSEKRTRKKNKEKDHEKQVQE